MVCVDRQSSQLITHIFFSFLLRNAPFNKEELSSILKFGAEDLFKDQDQDADQKLHVSFLVEKCFFSS